MSTTSPAASRIGGPGDRTDGAWAVLRRGLAISPEITRGLRLTLLIALVSTIGRVVVPIAVQQTIDRGIRGPDGPRPGLVLVLCTAAAGGPARHRPSRPSSPTGGSSGPRRRASRRCGRGPSGTSTTCRR